MKVNTDKKKTLNNKKEKQDLVVPIPNEIRYVDLFAGLGGFRVAFNQVTQKLNIPAKCVLVSEIDKEVIKTYKANFGAENEQFVDIKKIKATDVPDHDFLFAGFPCQTFSNAGKKKGFLDESRGKLFFYICEILRVKRPKYALLENVKHIVSHNHGKTGQTIISELTKIGYLLPKKPLILSPVDFGIPQDRQRVFIPMVLKEKFNKNYGEYLDINLTKLRQTEPQHHENFKQIRKTIVDKYLQKKIKEKYCLKKDSYLVKVFSAGNEFIQNVRAENNKTLPVIGLDWLKRKISPAEMNSFPSGKQKYLHEMRALYKANAVFIDHGEEKGNTKNGKKRERKLEGQAGLQISEIKDTFIQLRQSGIRCRKPISFPTLVAMVQIPIIYHQKKGRYLTPRETANLQCFPKNYRIYSQIVKNKQSDFYSYKQFGNSVNIELVKRVQKGLLENF